MTAERATLSVDVNGHGRTSALVYRAGADDRVGTTLVLAHGAGAGQLSPFMVSFAVGLARRGLDVVTFDFLYMERRKKVPDRPDTLEACYRAVIQAAGSELPQNEVIIGGKSMGGRIASHLAATKHDPYEGTIRGLVLLGYPLHPPGKPDQLRVSHLQNISVPVLCIQGERDPFGSPDELRPHFTRIKAALTLQVVANGDHSLAPSRNKSVVERTYSQLQDVIAAWIPRAHR
jgi:predicted alpha/beta-hydrolase family hydrolase